MLVCVCVCVCPQDEKELEQGSQADGQAQDTLRDLRQKVEEAKSSLSSNRSRGKVLEALMQQKSSGKITGILGRLVRRDRAHTHTIAHTHDLSNKHTQANDQTCDITLPTRDWDAAAFSPPVFCCFFLPLA